MQGTGYVVEGGGFDLGLGKKASFSFSRAVSPSSAWPAGGHCQTAGG